MRKLMISSSYTWPGHCIIRKYTKGLRMTKLDVHDIKINNIIKIPKNKFGPDRYYLIVAVLKKGVELKLFGHKKCFKISLDLLEYINAEIVN